MKLIFIDEVQQYNKDKNFFGVGAFVIDSSHYTIFKDKFSRYFNKLKWPDSIEFKGRYLFSEKVDKKITIDNRINFVKNITKISIASKNARFNFLFSYNFKGKTKKNFLLQIEKIGKNIKSPTSIQRDKNLLGIFYDNTNIVSSAEFFKAITKKLNNKFIILERPFCIKSGNNTRGIILADILCYLTSWIILGGGENNPPLQLSLFAPKLGEINAEKLMIVKEIISNVKKVKIIKI
jgi:hypothetical protein